MNGDREITLTYKGKTLVFPRQLPSSNREGVLTGGLSDGDIGKPVSLCYCSDCKECDCQGVLFPQCECTCEPGGCGPCDGLQAAQ